MSDHLAPDLTVAECERLSAIIRPEQEPKASEPAPLTPYVKALLRAYVLSSDAIDGILLLRCVVRNITDRSHGAIQALIHDAREALRAEGLL